jgi:uncharacterized protein YjbI with pentapeptide repeats
MGQLPVNSSHPFMAFLKILLGILLCLCLWIMPPAQAALQNYSNADLKGQSFAGEKLIGGVFLAAEMRETNFSNTDLTGAIFTKGTLLRANFHGSNLTNALLDQATLDEADLSDAILVGATMTRTRFFGAGIKGADFTDAIIDRSQIRVLCEVAIGTNSRTGVNTKESLGC